MSIIFALVDEKNCSEKWNKIQSKSAQGTPIYNYVSYVVHSENIHLLVQ